jgi:glucose-1-phosphate adenylyltransferase
MGSKVNVLAIILAGGEGKRIMPLTKERSKPAVPFGGTHRLIDFPLSNLINSGYRKIAVLTQYMSHSMNQHIAQHWQVSPVVGDFIMTVPSQQRTGKDWYLGSADAIYQNINVIKDTNPDYVLILGADNIYRMDFHQMVKAHIQSGADFSVAGIRQPISLASEFGVINVDKANPVIIDSFVEKPENPIGLPNSPNEVFASMGNYCASTEAFLEALELDHSDEASGHDMGGNIVPYFVEQGKASVYDFNSNIIPGTTEAEKAYWRDVGSIDAYYDAHQDMISKSPIFNMYNMQWPISTGYPGLPPAKFVHDKEGRTGTAVNSLVSPGCIISGAQVKNSILAFCAKIHSYSTVENSIILDKVVISEKAHIKNAIIDKHSVIGEGVEIGFDKQADLARGFTVSENGITVVPRNSIVSE